MEVCKKMECVERRSKSCQKTHECGHFCGGLRNEAECLPCLNPDCIKDANQNSESFCNICWVEDLASAPSVKLTCGHIFHYHCIAKQVSDFTFGLY